MPLTREERDPVMDPDVDMVSQEDCPEDFDMIEELVKTEPGGHPMEQFDHLKEKTPPSVQGGIGQLNNQNVLIKHIAVKVDHLCLCISEASAITV